MSPGLARDRKAYVLGAVQDPELCESLVEEFLGDGAPDAAFASQVRAACKPGMQAPTWCVPFALMRLGGADCLGLPQTRHMDNVRAPSVHELSLDARRAEHDCRCCASQVPASTL